MNDIVLSIVCIVLVIVGWATVIIPDFEKARGQRDGQWVHVIAGVVCFLLIVWVVKILS
ncbi:hypothetical protein [Halobacillus litoralis]|uniref:hypothetical protein n=1 Tax=Halobacillus litoralis TaxID=45668 RepID=UPI001CFDBE17|nr:hypothetical protein [Halobacillus litoralis]